MKPTNAYKHIFYYKHNMPPTCFSQCCGPPLGGAL